MVVTPFFSLTHISDSAGHGRCSMTTPFAVPEGYARTGSPDIQKQSDGRDAPMVKNDRL